jgi:hypothetical protein
MCGIPSALYVLGPSITVDRPTPPRESGRLLGICWSCSDAGLDPVDNRHGLESSDLGGVVEELPGEALVVN